MQNEKSVEMGVLPDQPPPYEGPSPPGQPGPPPAGSSNPADQLAVQVTEQPTMLPVVVTQQIGPKSTKLQCPSCNIDIMTKVESKATMRTHLFAALLCVIGGLICVFIPYCIDSCKNSDHYCPNCGAYIGSYVPK